MTAVDSQTEVLPSQSPAAPPAGDRPAGVTRVVLTLTAVIISLILLVALIAEWIARSEAERDIADGVRSYLGQAASQHVEVELSGFVLPQVLLGRLDEMKISLPNFTLNGASADVYLTARGMTLADSRWERASGQIRVGADQMSALTLPDGGTGPVSIGFRGSEMVVAADLSAGTENLTFSAAIRPELKDGRLVASLASITLGDTTLTTAELVAQAGPELARQLEPQSLCVAESLPRGTTLTAVEVREQHLVFDFELETTGLGSIAGPDESAPELGSCA